MSRFIVEFREKAMLVNVDGYIVEVPDTVAIIRFTSGVDGCAGSAVYRDANGELLETKHVAAEFNLPQRPWYERIND